MEMDSEHIVENLVRQALATVAKELNGAYISNLTINVNQDRKIKVHATAKYFAQFDMQRS